ncbi:hypothetical protein [Rhizobium leguminosarum]|uniref:hypothetical protein n=1 Tax=Rhizobium leguminosarum TaxID=384 RepID=UPI001C9821BB|nr:hypothetical protein [Rhizobium leguminosarum]MBY5426998.1 hypothetical protein [Rhizobium leguminosarum]
MSNVFRQVDLIIVDVRRRRRTTERNLQIIDERHAQGSLFPQRLGGTGLCPNRLAAISQHLKPDSAGGVKLGFKKLKRCEVASLLDAVQWARRKATARTVANQRILAQAA